MFIKVLPIWLSIKGWEGPEGGGKGGEGRVELEVGEYPRGGRWSSSRTIEGRLETG